MSVNGIDVPRLAGWLWAQGVIGAGEVTLSRLSGGQSNPTFVLETPETRLVLRTRPPGELLASAHAIDREYRVMQALAGSAVPVPRMLAYCKDDSVIGREFFVMEHMAGRVFMDPALPGMTIAARTAIYEEMNRVIAALHSVNVDAVGLGDYGRRGAYFERQVARWSRQCRESRLPVGPSLQRLMDWLPHRIPEGDETTLVHGDFRIDNLVFHTTKPEVIAVLDWELSTLGHPLADLAYHGMAWHIPAELWRGVAGLDLLSLGIPREAEYVRSYERSTGRAVGRQWDFCMAFNLFRIAAILHGIAARALAGNASAADAEETGRKAEPLARIGWACAQRHEARLQAACR